MISAFALSKEKAASLCWQHLLLFGSLFIMTFGGARCIRSNLGSSVISSVPLSLALAGEAGFVPRLTLGDYTNLMNICLVVCQLLVLRRRFEAVQLLQLVIGFFFSFFLDLSMALTSWVVCPALWQQAITQVCGCLLLGTGIAFEVRCGSVTMPGEGLPAAVSKACGVPFATAKIIIDISLVAIAVVLCYLFLGTWMWNVVGFGTIFAMIFVGMVVKFYAQRLGWFERLLHFRPGFRRYIYGLARHIYGKKR